MHTRFVTFLLTWGPSISKSVTVNGAYNYLPRVIYTVIDLVLVLEALLTSKTAWEIILLFSRTGFLRKWLDIRFSYKHAVMPTSSILCWNLTPFGALPLPSVCLPLIDMHKPMTSPRKEVFSCILIWIRFTNERHSTTIGTIGLPRLAREVTWARFSDSLLKGK